MIRPIIETLNLRSEPITESGCIIWTGATTKGGYGAITIDNKNLAAHRVAFQEANGVIDEGLQVNHTCDIRCCINPRHLYQGTQSDNMKDKFKRNRHDMKGEKHPFSKLTEIDVQNIKKKLILGKLHKDIAKEYNVSRGCISYISRGDTWNV